MYNPRILAARFLVNCAEYRLFLTVHPVFRSLTIQVDRWKGSLQPLMLGFPLSISPSRWLGSVNPIENAEPYGHRRILDPIDDPRPKPG
jgi:hypothetical protein